MKLTDFFRYAELAKKLARVWDGFRHTPVGGEVTVPRGVADLPNGQRWETDAHTARRLK